MEKTKMNPKGIVWGLVISAVLWSIIIAVIVVLCGCQTTTLQPLEGHLYFVPKDTRLQTTNHGVIITQYEGVWFSEFYIEEMWEMGMPK